MAQTILDDGNYNWLHPKPGQRSERVFIDSVPIRISQAIDAIIAKAIGWERRGRLDWHLERLPDRGVPSLDWAAPPPFSDDLRFCNDAAIVLKQLGYIDGYSIDLGFGSDSFICSVMIIEWGSRSPSRSISRSSNCAASALSELLVMAIREVQPPECRRSSKARSVPRRLYELVRNSQACEDRL